MKRTLILIACTVIVYSTSVSVMRAQSAAPASSHQLVLQDGRHAVATGKKFMLVSPNGQLLPAPAGVYTLANGVELNVDGSGTPHQLNRNEQTNGGGVLPPTQVAPSATVLTPPTSSPERVSGSPSEIADISSEKLVAPPEKKALTLSAAATHLFCRDSNPKDPNAAWTMRGQIWASITDDTGQPVTDLRADNIEIDCLDIPPGATISPPFSSPAELDIAGSRLQDGLVHFNIPKLALGNHYYRIHIKLDRRATPSGDPPVHYEGQTLVSALYVGLPTSENADTRSLGNSGFGCYYNVYPPGAPGSP